MISNPNCSNLSKICRILYKDILLCISGKRTLIFWQDKVKKEDFILYPLYPIKGIELLLEKVEGIVRIVRNPDNAQKCHKNEITVSSYIDRSTISAVVCSNRIITSVGSFFSCRHTCQRYEKPSISAVTACDRIFSNRDRITIKKGLIFKL